MHKILRYFFTKMLLNHLKTSFIQIIASNKIKKLQFYLQNKINTLNFALAFSHNRPLSRSHSSVG